VSIEIVFETHALSQDNERDIATGWLPGALSVRGRHNAADMARRRRDDGIVAVSSSDLRRASETAQIAFAATKIPILYDWRLRECDFGQRNGTPAAALRPDLLEYLDRPYPRGESHRRAARRVAGFLSDLPTRWTDTRVMVIGHVATQRALEHVVNGVALEDLLTVGFQWREHGWQYRLD